MFPGDSWSALDSVGTTGQLTISQTSWSAYYLISRAGQLWISKGQLVSSLFPRKLVSWLSSRESWSGLDFHGTPGQLNISQGKLVSWLSSWKSWSALDFQGTPSLLTIKGSLTQDFRHQIFFINQCPRAPEYPIRTISIFFQKFAEIFANECLSAVSTTPAKKEKNFEINFFHILLRA